MAINWFVALQICTYNKIVTCPIQYLLKKNIERYFQIIKQNYFFICLNLTETWYDTNTFYEQRLLILIKIWYVSLGERITAKIF